VKIVIIGLPGSGKSRLTAELCKCAWRTGVNIFSIDADVVRAGLSSDLGFSRADRLEQARRMAAVGKLFHDGGAVPVVMNLVCPTQETRQHFKDCVMIWLDTVKESRFPDTDALFQPATDADIIISEKLGSDLIPGLYSKICQKYLMKERSHVDCG
jgi:adenylylsulfate kinase